MPKGRLPEEYWHNPHISKPLEEIYTDIDAWTFETFEDEPHTFAELRLWVIMPPLMYEGQFVKGILLFCAVDMLLKQFPVLSELFHTAAYTGWSSYPWSTMADAYFTGYKNQHREDWFRKAQPLKAHKSLIPLEDSDFLNEYLMAPPHIDVVKDIDILCVSRLHCGKNLPVIAEALKIHRQKYPQTPARMTLIVNKEFDINWYGLEDYERNELKQVESILVHPRDYIDYVTRVNYYPDMPKMYSRSRVCILGSLIEGKNRSLKEALSCNTPVICFKEFNQYARGGDPVFPDGAGLYADYNPESLADTIQTVLQNPEKFNPRQQYLHHSGRKNFLNQCIDNIPYYQSALPGYTKGRHHLNLWLDLAIQQNYQLSLNDFLYDKNHTLTHPIGWDSICRLMKTYLSCFNMSS